MRNTSCALLCSGSHPEVQLGTFYTHPGAWGHGCNSDVNFRATGMIGLLKMGSYYKSSCLPHKC